jgi:hypothetical protein
MTSLEVSVSSSSGVSASTSSVGSPPSTLLAGAGSLVGASGLVAAGAGGSFWFPVSLRVSSPPVWSLRVFSLLPVPVFSLPPPVSVSPPPPVSVLPPPGFGSPAGGPFSRLQREFSFCLPQSSSPGWPGA